LFFRNFSIDSSFSLLRNIEISSFISILQIWNRILLNYQFKNGAVAFDVFHQSDSPPFLDIETEKYTAL